MLIVGCGYLGMRLAAHYRQRGERVRGLVRTDGSAAGLVRAGVEPLRADLDADPLPGLGSEGERVFYLAPPPERGAADPRIGRVIEAFGRDGHPRRLVYIGTTGVYGDCAGAWVDETRPLAPAVDRARRRLDAEERLRAWSRESGAELVILRVAGIYGPGRLPLARIGQGLPIVRAEESPYTNRIHADDLAAVCVASMERPVAGEVFNVSDGHPGTMADYFDRIADRAGLPRPPKIPMGEAAGRLSEGMLSYMRESRRLDNRKLREVLGVALRYPTLEQGLDACFA